MEATNIDMDSGMAAAAQLIAAAEPTAIVATSDVHAVAALKVLKAKHISVPDQVSVIGFDDAPIADLMDLTTMRQPLADKGREAATILLELIAGRTPSVKPTQLIVRATTGPAHCRWQVLPAAEQHAASWWFAEDGRGPRHSVGQDVATYCAMRITPPTWGSIVKKR